MLPNVRWTKWKKICIKYRFEKKMNCTMRLTKGRHIWTSVEIAQRYLVVGTSFFKHYIIYMYIART